MATKQNKNIETSLKRSHAVFQRGFALPTVIITSIAMMIVLLASLQSVSSINASINTQVRDKMARLASESGIVFANKCLSQNDNVPTWTESKPLRPGFDCNGDPITSVCPSTTAQDDGCFVLKTGNYRTTFRIGAATVGSGDRVSVKSEGTISMVRTSNGQPFYTSTTTTNLTSGFREMPMISGGAGWQENGHIALVGTTNGQLYGFGYNSAYQITNSGTPASVSNPVKMDLPAGVSKVTKITTSGRGASILCIIGDNQQAYCRAENGGATSGAWGTAIGWNRVGISSSLKVFDLVVNGYGADNACVRAGTTTSNAQVYCWGANDGGKLGCGSQVTGCTNTSGVGITAPQRFQLSTGLTAKKVFTQGDHTCVIDNNDDAYCAGLNNGGQTTNTTVTGFQNVPSKFNLPSMGYIARKAKSVIFTYHNAYRITVLATDGSIWSAGFYGNGDFGNYTTSGGTYSGGVPSRFGYGGGKIRNVGYSGRCIDNVSGNSGNGAKIAVWSCAAYGTGQASFNQELNVTEDGHLMVSNGKCLDINGGAQFPAEGELVVLWDCYDGYGQKYTFQSDGSIRQTSSNLCITFVDGNNDTWVRMLTCNPARSDQKFRLDSPALPFKDMISQESTLCGIKSPYSDVAGQWASNTWGASGGWCAGQNTYGQFANYATVGYGGGADGGACVSDAAMRNINLPPGEVLDYRKISDEWRYQHESLQVITESGRVFSAGRNIYGKFGNLGQPGSNGNGSGLGDSANSYRTCHITEFKLPVGVKALDMSTRDEYTTYVLGDNGQVYAAGRGNNGQLGNGTTTPAQPSPVSVRFPRQTILY